MQSYGILLFIVLPVGGSPFTLNALWKHIGWMPPSLTSSHFENGCDLIMCLDKHASVSAAPFCSLARIFLQPDNSVCVSVLPDIKYAVTSLSFSKWDKVKVFFSSLILSQSGL